ncbi:flagellar hook-length control protein FliK [Clostridium chrysemydis]|uniref:flagellar hook-length control protein FliK n=1 Tax=Clostridium chrysemydis TaxID=2665504 RepID=UPI001884493C|nr:flagellar hook-length control protein FliK [Clostridium chrysemydis]
MAIKKSLINTIIKEQEDDFGGIIMPSIWGVNNGYNVENKKISSKITFKLGEKFKGKITAKGEGNEVTIKTSDGWQFKAEIDGNVDLENGKNLKFEVSDFKDGKVKLKVVSEEAKSSGDTIKDNLEEIIKKEGLSKDDEKLLREMIKRDIPLTKENIKKFKSIIQFSEKLNINPKEGEDFILKYLQSKGIDLKSPEGQKINEMLKNFFGSFKTMSKEDIMIFLENNIDLTKENIDSFNKLFKEESGVSNLFKELGKKLIENSDILKNISLKEEGEPGKENIKGDVNPKNIQTLNENETNIKENMNSSKNAENINSALSKAYEGSSKVSVLEILKNIVSESGSKDLTNITKDILSNEIKSNNGIGNAELNKIQNILSSINDDEFIEVLKNNLGEDKSVYDFTKSDLEKSLSNIFKSDIKLTEPGFSAIKSVINEKVDLSSLITEENKNILLDDGNNTEAVGKEIKDLNNSNILEKDTNSLLNSNSKGESTISKDINLKNLENEIKSLEDLISPKAKEEIKEALLKGMQSKDIVRLEAEAKIDVMKDIINKTLKGLDTSASEKVMQLIKENINDFKVFNSISNEYYYLDLPIQREEREYPCKLIIKDDRKDGKKIDKTNVKLVVSVKTINLGMIDSYLTVNNKNLKVDLKCENNYVTLLKTGREALIEGLKTLGFNPSIDVSMRGKEVSLSDCREFFADDNNRALDIMV